MLRREIIENGVNLVIAGEGVPRVFSFPTIDRLIHFQNDMEAFLLRTGWTFVEFSPERRTGVERRHFPRRANDRRRWWTDSVRLFLRQGNERRR